MIRRLSAMVLALGVISGCGSDQSAGAIATGDESPATDAAERDPLVSYDLRRLRPREGETLSAMFDRMHGAAVAEDKRVLVMFSADWCEPCRHIDLELGNSHPASMIGDVRVLEIKEDDWVAAARMDEFNALRRRWEPVMGTYPLVVLLDAQGKRVDEMKEAAERLEAQGVAATLPVWLESSKKR